VARSACVCPKVRVAQGHARLRAAQPAWSATELIKVVSDALKTNLTMLGPLILPLSEQVLFLVNLAEVHGWRMAPCHCCAVPPH
jgi:hypothetical protein